VTLADSVTRIIGDASSGVPAKVRANPATADLKLIFIKKEKM